MHCIYCHKVLVDEEQLNRLEKSGVFSGPVKDFVAQTKTVLQINAQSPPDSFQMVSDYAVKSPQTTLEQVMQSIYPNALRQSEKIPEPAVYPAEKLCQKASA